MTHEKPGRPRLVLLALVVVFAAPFVGAWLVYNFTGIGRDEAPGSYGQLLVPPVPVADRPLHDPAGVGDQRLHGKWSLVTFLPANCGRPCTETLATLRQVRVALGGDAARLQLVAVTGSGELPSGIPERLRRSLLLLDEIAADELRQAGQAGEGGLLLIDPLGNLMMRYPPASAGEGILGDLKRLLRYSRIG